MVGLSSWWWVEVVGRVRVSRRRCGPSPAGVAVGVRGCVVSLLGSLLVVLAVIGVCAGPAAAKTAVTSNITASTTWTMAGSPYDIDGSSIKVVSGVTLTIEPGVTVGFNSTEGATLFVEGIIKAIGTSSNPIVITSSQALLGGGAPGQYQGLSVTSGNASSQLSYTDFYYGGAGSGPRYYYGELQVSKGSTVGVDHSVFEHNAYAGIKVAAGTANISYSMFATNGVGISAIGENVLNIKHNAILKNVEDGVFWNAPEKPTKPTGMSVLFNTINENALNGIYVEQSCTSALSLFPHGEYNNIYTNGGAKEAKKQLGSLNICKGLPVDWANNYWGQKSVFISTKRPRNAPLKDI